MNKEANERIIRAWKAAIRKAWNKTLAYRWPSEAIKKMTSVYTDPVYSADRSTLAFGWQLIDRINSKKQEIVATGVFICRMMDGDWVLDGVVLAGEDDLSRYFGQSLALDETGSTLTVGGGIATTIVGFIPHSKFSGESACFRRQLLIGDKIPQLPDITNNWAPTLQTEETHQTIEETSAPSLQERFPPRYKEPAPDEHLDFLAGKTTEQPKVEHASPFDAIKPPEMVFRTQQSVDELFRFTELIGYEYVHHDGNKYVFTVSVSNIGQYSPGHSSMFAPGPHHPLFNQPVSPFHQRYTVIIYIEA